MKFKISKKSTAAFKSAAKKIKISAELPGVSMLREDLALYITAIYMLSVIIEAEKNGDLHDITKHGVRKYEPWHYAEEGYVPGSSGGGFSFRASANARGCSSLGARLSSNSWSECEKNSKAYPDLWEIVKLYVK
ncbi:hypothetical protein ACTJIJ_19740 [Niabella sp. 22666]|uniref:hypothetical protein n=1 Tax=Niabella sp. 22666 TaxID=3453954 RepID=UPI003F84CCFE